MKGCHVQALDGEIAHVGDLLMNDHTWQIQYLPIDTSKWIGGKSVMIPREWAKTAIQIDVSTRGVTEAPALDLVHTS
jgi:hypothetical protein